MKRNIIKISVLSVLLIVLTSSIVLLKGRVYTATFSFNPDDEINFSVDNDKGNIKILDKKIKDNQYIVKVKALKPGIVYLKLDYRDVEDLKVLYIHKSLVITENNYFGKSNGSEVIPISVLILLFYIIVLLIKEYRISMKKNIYQYKNIAYLGIIVFLTVSFINILQSIFHYQGFYSSIDNIIRSSLVVSFYLFPITFITFILVIFNNIRLIKREGKSLKNLLGLFLGIYICISTILPDFIYSKLLRYQIVDIYNLNGPGPYLYNFFETLNYLLIAYLECVLIGTIVIAVKSTRKKPLYNQDYMIILGCKIREDGGLTPLLKGRVDRALSFREEQLQNTGKDLIFIPSGGKGNDEVIAEGEAIKNYLLEQGIHKKNILVENKSKNTYENIKYSYQLINNKKANICFSTTNYHVLRAGLIATEQHIKINGIGSKTKAYFWINAFIREFIGTLYSEKKKHLLVLGIVVIVLISMISITYFANNIG